MINDSENIIMYQCNICGQPFKDKDELNKHNILHIYEKLENACFNLYSCSEYIRFVWGEQGCRHYKNCKDKHLSIEEKEKKILSLQE